MLQNPDMARAADASLCVSLAVNCSVSAHVRQQRWSVFNVAISVPKSSDLDVLFADVGSLLSSSISLPAGNAPFTFRTSDWLGWTNELLGLDEKTV